MQAAIDQKKVSKTGTVMYDNGFSAISRHLPNLLDSFINLKCCSRLFYELATSNLDITSVVGLERKFLWLNSIGKWLLTEKFYVQALIEGAKVKYSVIIDGGNTEGTIACGPNTVKQQTLTCMVTILGHSQYILWATSPLMRGNCPRREKKPDI